VSVSAITSPITDYFASIGVEGIGIYAYDRIIRELKKQSFMWTLIKSMKQYYEPGMEVIISIVLYFALQRAISGGVPTLALRAVRAGGSYGVYGAFAVAIKDKPVVVATAPDTLVVYNLDPSDAVAVKIDGSAVKFDTAPTTDANGGATITLPSAMSAGAHQIQVATRFKCAYTEQYVGSA